MLPPAANASASRVARALDTARFVKGTYGTLRSMKRAHLSPGAAGARLAADSAAMGPLYVKLAQFISARRDVVDPEFIDALSVVQDRLPFEGRALPPELPGYSFDAVPIGRASIADVFVGVRLRDGARVVVKSRREGVKERVQEDLPLLQGVMAVAAACGLPGARNMCELIRESGPMVLAELDFAREAASQAEFAGAMEEAAPWVVVPRVIDASEAWMVSEYVPSRRLAEVRAPNPALARRLMDLYMIMLDVGFVHADPHPGNVGILPGGRVVLYDFGAMLRVDDSAKTQVAKLLQSSLVRDAESAVHALETMGVITVRPGQRASVRRIVRRLLTPDSGVHEELRMSPEFASSGGRRMVTFGQTFIYLTRTLTLVDGSCRALDPGFSYDYSSWVDVGDVGSGLAGFARDVASIPSTMRTMQEDMEEFQSRIVGEIDGGKQLAATASAVARAAAALAALAFFLG